LIATDEPLVGLPHALRARGYTAPTYRQCYTASLDARIPTTRGANGRWTFNPADLEIIAEALNAPRSEA
jgi:hypothetical protein